MPKFRSLQKIVFEKKRLGGGVCRKLMIGFSKRILESFRSKVGLSEIRSQSFNSYLADSSHFIADVTR